MPANPNFHLPQTHVPGEIRKALWRESFVRCWSPTLSLGALVILFPPGDAHSRRFIIALLSLLINVFTKSWELIIGINIISMAAILSDHFDINLLLRFLTMAIGSYGLSFH